MRCEYVNDTRKSLRSFDTSFHLRTYLAAEGFPELFYRDARSPRPVRGLDIGIYEGYLRNLRGLPALSAFDATPRHRNDI